MRRGTSVSFWKNSMPVEYRLAQRTNPRTFPAVKPPATVSQIVVVSPSGEITNTVIPQSANAVAAK